jgi:hypothetical protein
MIESYKVLAQLSPNANTLTTAYTVPTATSSTISSIVICNTNNSQITFRVSVKINGEADNIKQYLYYDLPILDNDTFISTIGITLAASDIVSVYADNTNVSFNIFGVEIS